METTDAFLGLRCRNCDARYSVEDARGRCQNCSGLLDAEYDLDAADSFDLHAGGANSLWDYDALLPFPREHGVSLGEGATPLVACPKLAGELGVERVLVKDEGGNPTGALADRGLSVAVSAAVATDESHVALPSSGDSGQALAAYAARAGLDAHVFVPSRAGFVQKAMINVHGGDMTVVEGRLREATGAFRRAMDENEGWRPVAPFETPFRHEGTKTTFYEVVAALGGAVPDAVVHPTGHGAGLIGTHKAARELRALGAIDDLPRLYAAQASGCAPVARAVEDGAEVEPWDRPDTICGGIEVPEPSAGEWIVEAIRETGGGAVATDDDAILESAVTVACHEGVSTAPSGAAAASGAWELAENGAFDPDDTVVLVNTATGAKAADVLRSHLMSRGV